MDPKVLWTLAIAVAVIVVVLAWLASRQDRRRRLQRRFGPEYERVVRQAGSARKGEAALEARAERVGALHIRPLPEPEARGFASRWRQTQARFVDAPQDAVSEADALVNEVMAARGYPLGDFDQRADDISVDHPQVVSHYRAARDLAAMQAAGKATTEDLRQALVHYRALFDDLLELKDMERPVAAARDRELARGHR